DAMIRISQATQKVGTVVDQAQAVSDGRTIQTHIKAVQETRLALSRPLDEAKDKLIEVERVYLAPLIAERNRLAREVTAFQKQEEDRVAAKERARQDEINRLEQERLVAKALLAEAHPAELAQAQEVLSEATQAQRAVIVAPLPAPIKARGSSTRRKLCYR